MKYFSLFLLLLCIASCGTKTVNPLFQIIENDRIGFMDSTGKVVIAPKFHGAGEFSEGLASARINGKYGYIDETGFFVIKPQFEYATPFSEGIAIVYNSGKYFFIEASGKKAFKCSFAEAQPFQHGLSIVRTASGKFGAINTKGKLQIDTAYAEISPFEDGLAILHKLNPAGGNIDGVVDTLGKMVIPFLKYRYISHYGNGYFQVLLHPKFKGDDQFAFVDKTGKIVSSWFYSPDFNTDGKVSCGLVKVYMSDVQRDEAGNYLSEVSCEGYMDLKGKISIQDTNIKVAYDFSENRAFVRSDYRTLKIIDTKGKRISKHTFGNFLGDFENGIAFVECYNQWGMIDTAGKFTKWPPFSGTPFSRIGDHVVFSDYDDEGKEHLGILSKNGKVLINNINNIESQGFVNGLLKCRIDSRLAYIDKYGKTIWQEKKNKSGKRPAMNIDYMLAAHFHADTMRGYDVFSSHYSTDPLNLPLQVSSRDASPKNVLSVKVKQEQNTLFEDQYPGFTVILANTTSNSYKFNTQNGRLNMIVQALNQKGEWRDIEFVMSSWCGNSSYRISLPGQHYWKFVTPQLAGEFKTKLRIALKYIDPAQSSGRDAKEIEIYSNEYNGSVNPAQFWRSPAYISSGIMDPYSSL